MAKLMSESGKLLIRGLYHKEALPPNSAASFMDSLIEEDEKLTLIDCGFSLDVINDPYNCFLLYKDFGTGVFSAEFYRHTPGPLTCYDYSDKPMD